MQKENEIKGYVVDSAGKIFSAKVRGGQGRLDYSNLHELLYGYDKDGYQRVVLSYVKNNIHKKRYVRVHTLVWETFNGKVPDSMTIDHIDNDKLNNSLENLQILTGEDNSNKSPYRNKTYLIKDFNLNSERIMRLKEIRECYGISESTIRRLVKAGDVSSLALQKKGIKIKITENV